MTPSMDYAGEIRTVELEAGWLEDDWPQRAAKLRLVSQALTTLLRERDEAREALATKVRSQHKMVRDG